MPSTFLLDSGPLGLLAHVRAERRARIEARLDQEIVQGAHVLVPEIADYEVRRELHRLVLSGQIPAARLERLDQLKENCLYLPLTTGMWLKAAELWGMARNQGAPSASDASLDADMLLAAQALEVGGTVVTANPKHLARFVPTLLWQIP